MLFWRLAYTFAGFLIIIVIANVNPIVAALLLGIRDDAKFRDVHRQLSGIQVVDDDLLTTSMEILLSSFDPEVDVYNQ